MGRLAGGGSETFFSLRKVSPYLGAWDPSVLVLLKFVCILNTVTFLFGRCSYTCNGMGRVARASHPATPELTGGPVLWGLGAWPRCHCYCFWKVLCSCFKELQNALRFSV